MLIFVLMPADYRPLDCRVILSYRLCILSATIEWSDKFDELRFVFVFDFLLLHPEVVIVFEVGVDDDLVEVADDPDLGVGLDIIFRPLLQVGFLHVNLALVHNLQVQFVVVVEAFNFAILGVLDQPQGVIALQNYLLLLLPAHVRTQNLRNYLRIQHLLELVYRVLVLRTVLSQQLVELALVCRLNTSRSDLSFRRAYLLLLDLPKTLLQVCQETSS